MYHVAMSADGKWALGDNIGNESPQNIAAALGNFDEDAATFTPALFVRDKIEQIKADPCGRWWTMGANLYSADMPTSGTPPKMLPPLRTFAGSPVAIHPTLDVAVSVSGDSLVFQNFSDAGHSKQYKFSSEEAPVDTEQPGDPNARRPGTVKRPPRAAPPPGLPFGFNVPAENTAVMPCLAFDLAHDRVIYALGDMAYVLPSAGEFSTRSKRLSIAGSPALVVMAGRTCRHRLTIADGGAGTWSIESAPPFVKLDGNELVISPGDEQIGHLECTVKAARGPMGDSLRLSLDVGVPSVNVGFQIEGMTTDPAGKMALVWSHTGDQPINQMPEVKGPMDFALVDLDDLKMVGKQTVKEGIQTRLPRRQVRLPGFAQGKRAPPPGPRRPGQSQAAGPRGPADVHRRLAGRAIGHQIPRLPLCRNTGLRPRDARSQ